MVRLTLDAGALILADRNDAVVWSILGNAAVDGIPLVPAPVLAQVWRGSHNARMGQLLNRCRIVPLTEDLARSAGELCGRAGTADIVDATVVLVAADERGDVLTSDPSDLKRLAGFVRGIGRIRDVNAESR